MALFSRIKTWGSEILTSSDLNTEFNNIINNMKADKIVGLSASAAAMRATSDPGESGTESLASDIAGEIQRLRHIVGEITGKTYWYESPAASIADITNASGEVDVLADNTVTSAKIVNGTIVAGDIANNTITTTQISNSAGITGAQIASSTVSSTNLANGCINTDDKVSVSADIGSGKIDTQSASDSVASSNNNMANGDYTLYTATIPASTGSGSRFTLMQLYDTTTDTTGNIYVVGASTSTVYQIIFDVAGTERVVWRGTGSTAYTAYISDLLTDTFITTGSTSSRTCKVVLRVSGTNPGISDSSGTGLSLQAYGR